MTCPDCIRAEDKPCSPLYRIGCTECSARMLAHGIEHAKSRAQMRMTPAYTEQLKAAFGDGWEAGHMRVKHWAKRIDCARMGVTA